jgi:hypothetical protein
MDQTSERTWWGRNWKWAVPVGCLTPLLGCGGTIGLIFVVVFGAIKSSDVYTEALAKAKADQRVVAVLGEPIEAGYMVSGNIEVNGPAGKANLAIPISGPKKSGTLNVVATRNAGAWEYSTLQVAPGGSGDPIDLRARPVK